MAHAVGHDDNLQASRDFLDQNSQALLGQVAPGKPATPGTGVGIIDIFTAPSRRKKQQAKNLEAAEQRAQGLLEVSGIEVTPEQERALLDFGVQDFDSFEEQVQQIEESQGLNISAEAQQRIATAKATEAASKQSRLASVNADGRAEIAQNQQLALGILNAETGLRKEYHQRIKPSLDSRRSLELAISQMKYGTGPAAWNSGRIFVQQLDASMFASDEFAAQLAQAGVEDKIANFISWVEGGGALGPGQRADMLNSMQAIQVVFDDFVESVGKDMGQIIGNTAEASNGQVILNPQNVITMQGFHPRTPSVFTAEGIEAEQRATGTFQAAKPDPDELTPTGRNVRD